MTRHELSIAPSEGRESIIYRILCYDLLINRLTRWNGSIRVDESRVPVVKTRIVCHLKGSKINTHFMIIGAEEQITYRMSIWGGDVSGGRSTSSILIIINEIKGYRPLSQWIMSVRILIVVVLQMIIVRLQGNFHWNQESIREKFHRL